MRYSVAMSRFRLQRPALGVEKEYGDGRKGWRGKYHVYILVGGVEKRRGRELTFYKEEWKTKKAAQEEFDRIVKANTREVKVTVFDPTKVVAQPPPAVVPMLADAKITGPLTLNALADQYLIDKKGSWSPHWFEVMTSVFKVHLKPSAIGKMPLIDLKRPHIQQFLNAKALTHCAGIVTKLRTHINAMLELAVEDDVILKNRAKKIDMPKLRNVDQTILTKEQMAHVLMNATGRDGLVLSLSICIGLRPSETFALRVNDYLKKLLKIDEGSVNGVLGGPKTEESEGYVAVPEIVRERMEAWIKLNKLIDDDFLFPSRTGNPLRQSNYVRRQLRVVARDLGIPKITFQILRRSFCTHIQDHAKLKELQGAMRHKKADTSLNVYAKERAELTAGSIASLTDEFIAMGTPKKRVKKALAA
jgi:integrase